VQTSQPLDPANQYHVTISSNYNLRTLLVACHHYDNVTRSFFGLLEEHDRYTLCRPPVLFNGKQLPTARWQSADRGSYYLQNTETEFYIPKLDFYYWGTGSPLTLRLSADLSTQVRTASVKIVDVTWEAEQQREADRREKERQEAAALAEAERRQKLTQERLKREHEMRLAELQTKQRLAARIRTSVIAGAGILLIAFLWWMHATKDRRRVARLERVRREREAGEAAAAEAARARAQKAEAKRRAGERLRLTPNCQLLSSSPIAPGEEIMVQIEGFFSYHVDNNSSVQYADSHYAWWSGMDPGHYQRHNSLFFDDSTLPATPFKEERHLHQYRYLYTGTGARMAVFLRPPPFFVSYSHQNHHLTLTLAPLSDADAAFLRAQSKAEAEQEKERQRRLEEKAEAKRHRHAEELEAERRDRFRTIQNRYGDALFAWRTDDAALARYAREHRNALLEPRRKRDIVDDYTGFHDDDLDFVEWLRLNYNDLYHRIDEVFHYRVLAIAESLAAEETPRRPKLSPEERQAKFERYRQRALERDRVLAEDRMAAVRQKLNLLQQFRDDLEAYDLDEDERDRLIKEFEDDLFAQSEEDTHGSTFKKL
jgi:hypothetical protein